MIDTNYQKNQDLSTKVAAKLNIHPEIQAIPGWFYCDNKNGEMQSLAIPGTTIDPKGDPSVITELLVSFDVFAGKYQSYNYKLFGCVDLPNNICWDYVDGLLTSKPFGNGHHTQKTAVSHQGDPIPAPAVRTKTLESPVNPAIPGLPPKSFVGDEDHAEKTVSKTRDPFVSFSRFTKSNGIMTKKIFVNAGVAVKDGKSCWMSEGKGERVDCKLSELPEILSGLKQNQAITLGIHAGLRGEYKVLSHDLFDQKGKPEGYHQRCKEQMSFPSNPLCFLDIDDYAGIDADMDMLLCKLIPGWKDTARLIRKSVSAGVIYEGKEAFPGGGRHVFFAVDNADDLKRFKDALHVRCWLNDHGLIKIAKDGTQLVRNNLFDTSTFSPERLIFEASPKLCSDKLEQITSDPVWFPGGILDTKKLSSPTDEEIERYEKLVADRKAETADRAAVVKAEYHAGRVKVITAECRKKKLSESETKAVVKQMTAEKATLPLFWELQFDNLGTATFAEVLSDPDRFDLATLSDPYEPEAGRNKAKFFANREGMPCINSLLHGGRIFHVDPAEQVNPDDLLNLLSDSKTKFEIFSEENLKKLETLRINDKPAYFKIYEACRAVSINLNELNKSLKSVSNAKKNLKPSDIVAGIKKGGWSFALNDMDNAVECNGQRMEDHIFSSIFYFCHETELFTGSEKKLHHFCIKSAADNHYHPIKDYLNGLKWDGKDHISDLCAKFKSDDDPVEYSDGNKKPVLNVYLRKWIVGAVAKVFEHYQNPAITFSGPQGIGKSYLPKWLCSELKQCFVEHSLYGNDKDLDIKQATNFVWEVPELDASTRKTDVAALKAKISREVIDVRPSYGRFSIKKPAIASFFATLNPDDFLADDTGNRRYLCVRIKKIDRSYSQKIIPGQVWAQAMEIYKSGEGWKLTDEEEEHRDKLNLSHQIDTPLSGYISKAFEITGNETDFMATYEIIDHLRKTFDVRINPDRKGSMDIGKAMVVFPGVTKGKNKKDVRGYKGIKTTSK